MLQDKKGWMEDIFHSRGPDHPSFKPELQAMEKHPPDDKWDFPLEEKQELFLQEALRYIICNCIMAYRSFTNSTDCWDTIYFIAFGRSVMGTLPVSLFVVRDFPNYLS